MLNMGIVFIVRVMVVVVVVVVQKRGETLHSSLPRF